METRISNVATSIIENVYDAEHAERAEIDVEYQRLKQLYLSLSDNLNKSIKDYPTKVATLSEISKSLFTKRNIVSTEKSFKNYIASQKRLLPMQASKFLPDIQEFLKNLDIECQPDEFDKAVIGKIDISVQAAYNLFRPTYLKWEALFSDIENCSTPLDLLFHGLFHVRASQNVKKDKLIYNGESWFRKWLRQLRQLRIEKAIEQLYIEMLSAILMDMTGNQVHFMVRHEIKSIVRNAIKDCKKESIKDGTNKLPDKYGDSLLRRAESGDQFASKLVETARNEGCTDDDIREWWNLSDLERRMTIWYDNIFRAARFMSLADSIKVAGVSEYDLTEKEAQELDAKLWKIFPRYGWDPTDTRFASDDDRPLPHELRGRVNRWLMTVNHEELKSDKENYSSINAMVRDQIRKGNL